MFIKQFFSQQGFSLVQGMVVAGVVAGSSLVATRLLQDQKLAQRAAETRDQVDQVHKIVYSTLQDKAHCAQTFNGAAGTTLITGTNPASPVIVNLNGIYTEGSATPIIGVFDNTLARTYANGHVIVTAIRAEYPIYNAGGTVLRPGFGRLRVSYQRLSASGDINKRSHGSGYGAKDITKTVLIRVQRSGAVFNSCYSVIDNTNGICSLGATFVNEADCVTAGGTWTAAAGETGNIDLIKKFCEELNSQGANLGGGGTTTSMFDWDEATSTCKPRNNVCTGAGQVNMGINSMGQAVCKNLLEVLDLNNVIDNTGAGSCPPGSLNPRLEIFTISTPNGPAERVRIRCN